MATVVFPYDHSRDPMNPDDLAERIAAGGNLNVLPVVDIDPTSITVRHPAITETNRAQIQTLINGYVLDPIRTALPPGNLGSILAKAQKAVAINNAFLAIPSPTAAQVRDQVIASTKELTALIKLALNDTSDTSGT